MNLTNTNHSKAIAQAIQTNEPIPPSLQHQYLTAKQLIAHNTQLFERKTNELSTKNFIRAVSDFLRNTSFHSESECKEIAVALHMIFSKKKVQKNVVQLFDMK